MDELFDTGLQAPYLKLDSDQLVGAHDRGAGLLPVLLQWPSASLHRRKAPQILPRGTKEEGGEKEEEEMRAKVNNHWD